MGMFDWVKFKFYCLYCEAELAGFQTKDKENTMDKVSWKKLDRFYDHCSECGRFYEFNKFYNTKGNTLKDYLLTVKQLLNYDEYKDHLEHEEKIK